MLVASMNGVAVGHVQLVATTEPTSVELKSLAVAPAHQGRGIGKRLVDVCVARARTDGATHLVVATATADLDNLRFYQRQGFRMLRVERDVFTAAAGYPDGLEAGGIPARDRVWLDLVL